MWLPPARATSNAALRRLHLAGIAVVLVFALSGCQMIGPLLSTGISLIPVKLMFSCLPEGTPIDSPSGSKTVESIQAGDWVIGYEGRPVRVLQIHGYLEDPQATDFYQITFANGSSIDLCGMHRIGGIPAKDLVTGSLVAGEHRVTGISTYRGVQRSYDLLTEDAGYRIGGIPVNSMIEEMYQAGRTGGSAFTEESSP